MIPFRYTNDVIAICAFGLKINSLLNTKNQFYVLGRQATTFDLSVTLKFFLRRSFPSLYTALGLKIIPSHIVEYFKGVIRETIETRKKESIERQDMLQLMLNDKTNKLDFTEITAQAFLFFIAGLENISLFISLMAHEVASQPGIQHRLQDEIDDVLKHENGHVTYERINEMRYLDSVLQETLRRHPIGPFLDRVCTKRYELPPATPKGRPYVLEKGDGIWIPVAGIHWDPKHYEDPMRFDPDRFYDRISCPSQATAMGFGIGPRSCIGNRFAILEIKLLFFELLSKFNLKKNKKTPNSLKYKKGCFNLDAQGGFYLTVERRE